MYTIICYILSVIMLVSIFFIIKKMFIGVHGSDNSVISIVIIFLCIAGLICSLTVIIGTYNIDGLKATLDTTKSMPTADINMIKERILKIKTDNIIALIVGYSTFIFDYFLYKKIKKIKKQEQSKVKNHWNWNKFNS